MLPRCTRILRIGWWRLLIYIFMRVWRNFGLVPIHREVPGSRISKVYAAKDRLRLHRRTVEAPTPLTKSALSQKRAKIGWIIKNKDDSNKWQDLPLAYLWRAHFIRAVVAEGLNTKIKNSNWISLLVVPRDEILLEASDRKWWKSVDHIFKGY